MVMKQRIAYWDNLKYVMILFVVIGHFILENNSGIPSPFYKSFGTFIYLFHIPVFFFISGYFFRKKSALWNALTYVLYAVATKLVMFLGKWAVYWVAINIFKKSVKYEPTQLSFIRYSDIVWFLIVLAVAEVLMFVLAKVNTKILLIIAIIIGCLVGYIGGVGGASVAGDYFAWFRVLVMFPFFVFGKMIKEYNLVDKLREKRSIRIVGVVVLVAIFVIMLLNPQNISNSTPLFSGRNSYEVLSNCWGSVLLTPNSVLRFGALIRLVAYIVTSISIMCWVIIIPDINIPLITKCGGKTILIFMFHYLGLYFANAMGWSNIIATRSGKILFVLGAIAWTLVLSLVFYKVPDLIKVGVRRIKNKQ